MMKINKFKMIIIEGPDGVGKTELVKYLTENLKFSSVHFSAPKSKEEAKSSYYNFIDNINENIILDRSFWGEFVYAPIWRNYEPDYFNELETKLKTKSVKFDILSILLYRSSPFPTADDPVEILKQHNLIQQRFIDIFNKITSTDKIIFNLHNFSMKKDFHEFVLQFVKRWMNEKTLYTPFINNYYLTLFNPHFRFINGKIDFKEQCNKCELFKEHKQSDFYKRQKSITFGSGNLNAKVIFVGEAPGFKGCGKLGIPFYNDKSGMLLREAMFKSRILETEIYITNVVKCNPLDNIITGKDIITCPEIWLIKEIIKINPKKVLAIGKTAWSIILDIKRTYNLKFEVKFVNHPAYFLYKRNEKEFFKLFKKLAKWIKND